MNAGSLNYLKLRSNGKWAWPPMLFDNSVNKIEKTLQAMDRLGIVPECECFDTGIVRSVAMFVKAGMIKPPAHISLVMGVDSGMPAKGGPSLGVGPVLVPEYLRRKIMVLNRDSHQLTLAQYDRWAEPLEDGILRVVSLNLAVLLDTQQVQRFPWRRNSAPQYGISLQVAQLSLQGSQANLVTQWSVTDVASDAVIQQKIIKFSTSAETAGADAVAAAYSDLLLQLSEEIAAAIREASDAGAG